MCAKLDYSYNPSTCICKNGKLNIYDLEIVFDEIMSVTDSVSTNVTNTLLANVINATAANLTNIISTKVTSTLPISSDNKKIKYEMNCYIFYTFLLVIISLFKITIICYYYKIHRLKHKRAM